MTNTLPSRREQARETQATYQPNETVKAELRDKTALLFVGPAGVGKSTTLDRVADLDTHFARTGSIGTRPVSARDRPGLYEQYPEEEILEKIARHEVVQYAIHPTTSTIYATTPNMYEKPYSMLEMLPGGIDQFRSLGFGGLQVFYMVTEPRAWRQWFLERYPEASSERAKRLGEAITSLNWALTQPKDSFLWLNNPPGQQEDTARTIIRLTQNELIPTDHHELAKQMLDAANSL